MDRQQQRVRNDGQGGELFLVMLVNFFLRIVTLGIYHFWAKTRVRDYVWSHTLIDDERLQYTGTGGELFVGFLKAVGLFIGLAAAVRLVGFLADSLPGPAGSILEGILGLAILMLLAVGFGAIAYQVRRYILTRTNYRGIRCGLTGSAWHFGLLNLGCTFVIALTLGLALPWARMRLARYKLNNHYFGSERLAFEGSASDLFGYYIVCWLLALPTLGLTLIAYYLYELRYIASRARLGGVQCQFDVYFWPFIGMVLTNFLLLIVTFGLAYPWVKLRNIRFLLDRVGLEGDLDYATIRQEMERGDAVGEGFAEGLDGAFG
jgi:uncharacterized membrane protein YjgN (DUF898 family)